MTTQEHQIEADKAFDRAALFAVSCLVAVGIAFLLTERPTLALIFGTIGITSLLAAWREFLAMRDHHRAIDLDELRSHFRRHED